MDETKKPFACEFDGCDMRFTTLDHLNVHNKKHKMSLQFHGSKAASFVGEHSTNIHYIHFLNTFYTILFHFF